ncbi:hypothetical protein TGFOU_360530 [Toxoplasma gondii FOU]|uniref:Uncharacterized protein n=3 Tax=Toxoplasma gondii TaxID=5811 RepID=A0A086JH82_TOXGO|nr:hypothetical protein TGFOU_360530 [Toxoplasma gondii FOU]PUA91473.1 hypothetical protein TGBR9_360530 [Toxoplasma gondii TgCATBr9]RQX70997.1 hypothetical protein TGCAST_360530 [Toxoplasma gondii CAST]
MRQCECVVQSKNCHMICFVSVGRSSYRTAERFFVKTRRTHIRGRTTMDFGFPPPETDCASREKTQRWTEHCHFMLVVCLFVETGVCSRGGRVGSRACIPVHAHAHD